MAKRPKVKEVSKFGGVDHVGKFTETDALNAPVQNVNYNLESIEVKSDTHLEDDQGGGGAAIIRCFEFGVNPQAFMEAKPTKQQLFNSHLKGIELALWRDGMKVMPDVNPRILIDEKNLKYKIFVGAQPMRGHTLIEQPRTLSEQIHGN